MKIVCLIRAEPPLIYFTNRINSEHKLALVIVEKSKTDPGAIFSKLKSNGIRGSVNIIKNKYLMKKEKSESYNDFFGNQWQLLKEEIPCLTVENINSDVVHSRLKTMSPDLILDHGTSIVKNRILELSDMALNLHWGLSPYYRGTNCTKWALINWDPYNIGVTIHKLSKEIDGGSIACQKRAKVSDNDTSHSINMQLTVLGTDLILKIIQKMNNKEIIEFKKQDFSLGYLTYTRQWNYHLNKQVECIEKKGLMETMLKYPSRRSELPIVKMEN